MMGSVVSQDSQYIPGMSSRSAAGFVSHLENFKSISHEKSFCSQRSNYSAVPTNSNFERYLIKCS